MKEFLRDNGLDVAAIDRQALLRSFSSEMERGLAGEDSTLLMIPSFISIDRPLKFNEPVVVLDAGGTNLRAAVVEIGGDSQVKVQSFIKREMPGTLSTLGVDEFFGAFADFVMPLAEYSRKIGFCFSYAAEITPECDARLIKWSKQIRAPQVEGRLVGNELARVLRQRGWSPRIVMLNDTVATLLAARSVGGQGAYSAYVGFILGTGTNTAYVERNARIVKRRDLELDGSMAINVESGRFGLVQQSIFDQLLDSSTLDPGYYQFEKMIAGAYLGGLGLVVLRRAASAGVFSSAAAEELGGWMELGNKELDDFCGGAPQPGNPFLRSVFNEGDRARVVELCTPLYERAAVLTAVNLASAILKTGAGEERARPVCVNVDGSTFHRTLTADFQRRVRDELDDLLDARGVAYELVQVEDAPLIGAAVAGVM